MALLPVDEARARILRGVKPLAAETIKLDKVLGRVLAKTVAAKRDQPPFAGSAMDGYAVRAEDVVTVPVQLALIGTSAAGRAFSGTVRPGTAVRILTGAPLPKGADAIVIQENTTREGPLLTILQPSPPGKHVRKRGLDFAAGDELVSANHRIGPRDIGLLSAGNAASVSVRRKPRIVVFATGDELVLPGQKPRSDQIVSSNSHALQALAESFGAEVTNLGIIRDTLKATIAAVRKGLNADILISTGGASVGDTDFVQEAFKACDIKIDFWKIALRPGKPFMYGRRGKTHVMGLPGNPVSALITARIFLKPLITAMLGLPPEEPEGLARLTIGMPANDGRQDYVRAMLSVAADGTRTATPFSAQDSSMQRTLQQSHALIIRPPEAPAAPANSLVPVLILDF
jgi:molybdopterin molybdotransferase